MSFSFQNLLHRMHRPASDDTHAPAVNPTEAVLVDAEAFNRSALLALGAQKLHRHDSRRDRSR